MAAVSLSLDTQKVITLGDADAAQEVTFPKYARRYRLYFRTNPGKLCNTGTDAAAIGSDYETIPANQKVEFDVPGACGRVWNDDAATRKVFLASSTAATVVEVICYR